MAKSNYKIRYLTSFSDELDEILYYITFILKNEKAAERLLDNVINVIEKRKENPEGYEKYKSKKNFKYDWYRIYVGNFTIFYTVRDNVMEITHLLYSARNFDNLI